MSSLATLRQQLARIIDGDKPAAVGLPTGISELDRLLAGGGLPRGRLTELLGARGSGKATLIRHMVRSTLAAGGVGVACIDAGRTLAPRDWAALPAGSRGSGGGAGTRLWMVRPKNPARGAWCADVLLRSGAFALVVLDGAPVLSRAVAVRLTRLAREANAAFVVVGGDADGPADGSRATMLGGALRLMVRREAGGRRSRWGGVERGRPRRCLVTIDKGGGAGGGAAGHRGVEVHCAIDVARRLCTDTEIPDRRGVAWTEPGARTAKRGGRRTGAREERRDLPRKRRCAEPGDLSSVLPSVSVSVSVSGSGSVPLG